MRVLRLTKQLLKIYDIYDIKRFYRYVLKSISKISFFHKVFKSLRNYFFLLLNVKISLKL